MSETPIQVLETSLSEILAKASTDPWSLLMIQTLLWSFRRWSIHHLTADIEVASMRELIWDTHLDLVGQFAPKGLRDFALVWLNPGNVGGRADMLEELNSYFLEVVDQYDVALDTENESFQNSLAEFVDERITIILDRWLQGRSEYRIYPDVGASGEEFSAQKVYGVMQAILDSYIHKTLPTTPVQEPAPLAVSEAKPPVQEEKQLEEPSAPVPVPVLAGAPPAPVPAPAPEPESKVTMAAALSHAARRRTLKVSHRGPSKKQTRKIHKSTL
jgi:hypothetical protein